jgi:hypothetical protein
MSASTYLVATDNRIFNITIAQCITIFQGQAAVAARNIQVCQAGGQRCGVGAEVHRDLHLRVRPHLSLDRRHLENVVRELHRVLLEGLAQVAVLAHQHRLVRLGQEGNHAVLLVVTVHASDHHVVVGPAGGGGGQGRARVVDVILLRAAVHAGPVLLPLSPAAHIRALPICSHTLVFQGGVETLMDAVTQGGVLHLLPVTTGSLIAVPTLYTMHPSTSRTHQPTQAWQKA